MVRSWSCPSFVTRPTRLVGVVGDARGLGLCEAQQVCDRGFLDVDALGDLGVIEPRGAQIERQVVCVREVVKLHAGMVNAGADRRMGPRGPSSGGSVGSRAMRGPVAQQWPLVGRDDELDLLTGLVLQSDKPGVVVAGAAGVGKTRIAAEVAARWTATGRRVQLLVATRSVRSVPL